MFDFKSSSKLQFLPTQLNNFNLLKRKLKDAEPSLIICCKNAKNAVTKLLLSHWRRQAWQLGDVIREHFNFRKQFLIGAAAKNVFAALPLINSEVIYILRLFYDAFSHIIYHDIPWKTKKLIRVMIYPQNIFIKNELKKD
jgi:hypothetical protein